MPSPTWLVELVTETHAPGDDPLTCACGFHCARERGATETGFKLKFDYDAHRAHVAEVVWAEIERRVQNIDTYIPPIDQWVDEGIIPTVLRTLEGA